MKAEKFLKKALEKQFDLCVCTPNCNPIYFRCIYPCKVAVTFSIDLLRNL